MAQRKNQRLGKTAQAPDVCQVGLKLGDCLAQGAVVALFESLQFSQPGHERMTEGAVEEQAAMNLLVALFGVQSVVGGQDEQGVTAEPEQLSYRLAPQIVRARVVRRIEIGQNQNFHRLDRDSKPATQSWRAIPGIRGVEMLRTINIHLLDSPRRFPHPDPLPQGEGTARIAQSKADGLHCSKR